MKINVFASLIFLLVFGDIHAQSLIDNVSFYADVTANAGVPENRIRANNELIPAVENWLSSEEFSVDDLERIPYLSIKRPEDKSFHIITWQIIDGIGQHSYHGYIRSNEGRVTKLTAGPRGKPNEVSYDLRNKDDWYGAMYYNVLETKVDGEKGYLLFGYDGYKEYEHRKVVDVLTFEDGAPNFGAELFKTEKEGRRDDLKTRLLLEYSNDANVSLNYKEGLKMITHDHLISRIGRIPGQGPTMLPDGSYVGYKWDGKHWIHVEKIYEHVSEEPPTDGRVRTTSGKDLFGKETKSKEKKKRSK